MARISLGISAYSHGSAAAFVTNDAILYAAEEERFSRIKNDSNFPYLSISAGLKELGISFSDVSYVSFYESGFKKILRTIGSPLILCPQSISQLHKYLSRFSKIAAGNFSYKKRIFDEISNYFPGQMQYVIKNYDHHESHAATALFCSGKSDPVVLIVDSVGEFITTSVWIRDRHYGIKRIWSQSLPHSLGVFYSTITQFCGFKVDSGEYKLMGLAPYGSPKFVNQIENHMIGLCNSSTSDIFHLNPEYYDFMYGPRMYNNKLAGLFGVQPRLSESDIDDIYCDIASSAQVVLEKIYTRLVEHAITISGKRDICLGGGVALNCVANSKVLSQLGMRDVFVFPAANDSGSSVGCAYLRLLNEEKKENISLGIKSEISFPDNSESAYLGPSYSKMEVIKYLEQLEIPYLVPETESQYIAKIAQSLADSFVVGLFNGRMEFGPRSLGARSILADPRGIDTQSKVNLKIKYRESFRPFAPVILEEKLHQYFDEKTIPMRSSFMQFVGTLKEEWCLNHDLIKGIQSNYFKKLSVERSKFSSVIHVDWSARVQGVTRGSMLGKILQSFEKYTDTPMLINTSFNRRGEPIVCTPEDAFKCFLNTEIDLLAIEGILIYKKDINFLKFNELIQNTFELD